MYIEEAATDDVDTDIPGTTRATVDPRAMGEYFTTEDANSLLSQAMAAFGITFDDMSEVDIYKVYTGPPGETGDGFLDTQQGWSFALKAEQSAWSALWDIEAMIEEGGAGGEQLAAALTDLGPATMADEDSDLLLQGDAAFGGTPYGDSPHTSDNYNSVTEFLEAADGYNQANFTSLMQYANLFNWQDPSLSFLSPGTDYSTSGDTNIAMASASTFLISPSNYTDTDVTNHAHSWPILNISIDGMSLNESSYEFNASFIPLGDAAADFKETLRSTWRSLAKSQEVFNAHVNDACIEIAGTVTSLLDTKMLAKRQRAPKMPPKALTSLSPGVKTRPTSTITQTGLDWMGLALALPPDEGGGG
jgi:hypothetical protein